MESSDVQVMSNISSDIPSSSSSLQIEHPEDELIEHPIKKFKIESQDSLVRVRLIWLLFFSFFSFFYFHI